VVFVGSDNPQAAGLELARRHSIPTFTVDYRSIIRSLRDSPSPINLPPNADLAALSRKQKIFPKTADPKKVAAFLASRAVAEHQLFTAMEPYDVDLLVLAGFMRTLTPYLIDRFNIDADLPRIMNIHPSLLPAFPGTDGYGDAYRFGCKVAGCTVHFVDYGEDTGPIIGQKAFAIDAADTLDMVRQKGLKLEWRLYTACIKLFVEDRLETVKMTYDRPNGRPRETRTVVKIHPPKTRAQAAAPL
jgi:phosphoribosylglycinamide formyltransferase-1